MTTPPFVACHFTWASSSARRSSRCRARRPGRARARAAARAHAGDFAREQLATLHAEVTKLRERWYPQLAGSFFDGIEHGHSHGGGGGGKGAAGGAPDAGEQLATYFNAAAVLMGSQLRAVVCESISMLEDFFALYESGEGAAPLAPPFTLPLETPDSAEFARVAAQAGARDRARGLRRS